MANLTITVDEETLKRARIRAIERGESVNAYLAKQLERYADPERPSAAQRATNARLEELGSRIGTGSDGRSWTREELYDERRIG